jgi:hypothetical protein
LGYGALGLADSLAKQRWATTAIYDRYWPDGVAFTLDRGLNNLWTNGGLLYAPPLSNLRIDTGRSQPSLHAQNHQLNFTDGKSLYSIKIPVADERAQGHRPNHSSIIIIGLFIG